MWGVSLVFYPDGFLLSVQNCSQKNPSRKPSKSPLTPPAPAEIPTISLSPLKQNHKEKGTHVLCAVPVFLQHPPLFFPRLSLFLRLCPQRQSHQKCLSPLLQPGKTHLEFAEPGDTLRRSPCVRNTALVPSWSTSYNTFCSVFIHLLSQKHQCREVLKKCLKLRHKRFFITTANTKQACE